MCCSFCGRNLPIPISVLSTCRWMNGCASLLDRSSVFFAFLFDHWANEWMWLTWHAVADHPRYVVYYKSVKKRVNGDQTVDDNQLRQKNAAIDDANDCTPTTHSLRNFSQYLYEINLLANWVLAVKFRMTWIWNDGKIALCYAICVYFLLLLLSKHPTDSDLGSSF